MSAFESRPGNIPGTVLWRVTASDDDPELFGVVPDAVMDIVYFNGTLLFAGADTRVNFTPSSPGSVTWGIRLGPGYANQLLGMPADELTNQRFDLGDLVEIPESDQIGVHENPASGLEHLTASLWRRTEPDWKAVGLSGSIDRAAREGASVSAIAEQHSMSERTLRRYSDRVFGYGVKSLASIHRFQRTLRFARSGVEFGQVASLAGYSDQAHMSREVKRFAGVSLGALTQRGA